MSQSKLRLVEDFVLGLDRRPQQPPSSDVSSPVHIPLVKAATGSQVGGVNVSCVVRGPAASRWTG